jgi:hypothetical protein
LIDDRKSEPGSAPRPPLIALALLPSDAPPELARIEGELGETFGGLAELDRDSGSLDLKLEDLRIRIAPRAEKVPENVLDGPCRQAWYWPEASEVLANHGSHVAVILDRGSGSPAHHCLLLSKIADRVGRLGSYLGAYWDPATMVHSAAAFGSSVEEADGRDLPLRLWVHFHAIVNDDGTHSLVTTGLDHLGLKEIEVRAARVSAEIVNGWAYNIAHYQLVEGREIRHGEAVGTDRENWVRVHHLPSAIDPDRTVLYLDFDEGR